MPSLKWFAHFPLWYNLAWTTVIVGGAALEITGATHNKTLYTFTDMVKAQIPTWGLAAIFGMLVWHFLIEK